MFVRWLWVWLGGTLLLLGSNDVPVFVAGGLVHCWVLRRHLLGVVLGTALGLAGLTREGFRVVAVWGLGCGCVLSVA